MSRRWRHMSRQGKKTPWTLLVIDPTWGVSTHPRRRGRRFSLYVPEELVPQVQRWLDNGRALQDLLYQAASRNLQALKRERDQASKKGGGLKGAQDCEAADQFRRLGVAAARHLAGATFAEHLRFSGRS